ncbi:hypothetical protein ACVGOW_13530 [Pseudonocardia saturnea]
MIWASAPRSIYVWRKQDRIDKALEPGLSSAERSELSSAQRRIAEVETELAVHRRASELLVRRCARRNVGNVLITYERHELKRTSRGGA